VLVADDSKLVRRAICQALEDDTDIEVVGETTDFASTVRRANNLNPQIIVLDLHMPGGGHIVSISRSKLTNNCQTIAMSFSDDEETEALARSVGASALLDKMNLGTELIPAIKSTAKAGPRTF
jgi:DNA-binding NarL/FixJ family response regulator